MIRTSNLPEILALVILFGIAVYLDLKSGKIPNKLTIPFMLAGLNLRTIESGVSGLLESAAGIGLILVLFLIFGRLARIGGGDIKLMMAAASVVGVHIAIPAMLFSAVIGGIMAVIVVARYRALISTTRNLANNLRFSALMKSEVDVLRDSKGIKFRYSPAIAIGTFLAFFLRI